MSQTHRILIIGVGSIGERHVRCFKQTGRAAVSICELNDEFRERVASEYDVQQACASLDESLKKSEYDAAVIAAPAHVHIPIAQQCAEAGLHLLIEKPLALTLDGIDQLQQIIEQKKLIVGVGYTWRANPVVAKMKQALDSGKFGKPLEVYGLSAQHFPTFRPAYRDVYYADRAAGGGAIQDAMTHLLNLGQWFLGPITHLFADAAHQHLEGVEVEDTVHVVARHGQTVMGSYVLNQYQAPNEYSLTIVCERGTLRFESQHNRWRMMNEPNGDWVDHTQAKLERDDMFIAQANVFLDALEGKGQPLCSLEEGIETLKVILATLASADAPAWSVV